MALVPRTTNTDVTLNPISGVRTQGPDIGAAGESIGNSLQRIGSQGVELAVEQNKADAALDEAAAKQALARYTATRDAVLHTNDDAFYQQTGQNALNARGQVQDTLKDTISSINEGLTTPRQKAMFQHFAGSEYQKDLVGIGDYAGKQTAVYNDQSDAALQYQMNNTATIAALNGDDQGFAVAKGTLVNSIRTQAARNGTSGAPAQMAEDKAVTSLYAGIVQQKAVSDPMAAKAYLDAHRADMHDQDTLLTLDKQLHPFVEAQGADQIAQAVRGNMVGATVPASAATSDDVTVSKKMAQVENATGNPAAKNPASSAQGPLQFTDQTWLATMKAHGPPAMAAAIMRSGGRYVIADPTQAKAIWDARNDPAQATAGGAALAHDNRIALSRANVPVDDGSTYLAHVLGSAGAIRLLKADPTAASSTAIPQSWIDKNPGLRGTVHDAIGWAYKQMGGAPGAHVSANAPQQNDLDAQLAHVDSLQLPFAQSQQVKERLIQLDGIDKRLLDAKQTDAANQVWTRVLGDTPATNIRDIPPALWATVKPEEQRTIIAAMKANASGANRVTDPDTYLALSEKAGHNQLSFADVRAALPKLAKGDFDTMAGLARTIEKGGSAGDANAQVMGRINTLVGQSVAAQSGLNDLGLSDKTDRDGTKRMAVAARKQVLTRSILGDVGVWSAQPENKGKAIDDKTLTSIIDRRMIQTNAGDPKPVYAFETPAGAAVHVAIPPGDVNRIQARAMAALGRQLRPQELQDAYFKEGRGGI